MIDAWASMVVWHKRGVTPFGLLKRGNQGDPVVVLLGPHFLT